MVTPPTTINQPQSPHGIEFCDVCPEIAQHFTALGRHCHAHRPMSPAQTPELFFALADCGPDDDFQAQEYAGIA